MVETCLANTGTTLWVTTFLAGLLLAGSVLLIRKRRIWRNLSIGLVLFGLLVPQLAMPTYASAAVACANPGSKADTSTGVLGALQQVNVLSNDKPTPGSQFIPSTLTLRLLEGHVLGAFVSNDQKTVTAPTEGQYRALDTGVITFQPEPTFVGQAKGVGYSLKDTAGNVTSNTYTPTVTSTTLACTQPKTFDPRVFYSGTYANGETSETSIVDVTTAWNNITTSADGTMLLATVTGPTVSDPNAQKTIHSSNRGETWQKVSTPVPFGNVYASKDFSTLVGVDDQLSSIYISTDNGANWMLQTGIPSNSGFTYNNYRITTSADGSHIGIIGIDSSQQFYTTNRGASWSQRTYAGPGTGMWNMLYSGDGSKLIGTNDAGDMIVSTDQGATWSLMSGVPSDNYSQSTIAISHNGAHIAVAAQPGNVYVSHDGGSNWATGPSSTGWRSVHISDNGQKVVAVAEYTGYLNVSTNGGSTWSQLPTSSFSPSILVTASSSLDTMYVIDDSVGDMHKTIDFGGVWSDVRVRLEIAANDVDLDSATAGIQRTIDRTSTQGWQATYDPLTDKLTLTVTNYTLYDAAVTGNAIHIQFSDGRYATACTTGVLDVQYPYGGSS